MSEIVSDDISPLSRLRIQAANLVINSAEGDPIVRPGLITTLYFRHGHTRETKQRVDECFVWFRQQFKAELKWQFYKHVRKMTLSSFAGCRRKILDSSPDEQFIWSIGSGTRQEVAEYQLFVMNTPRNQADIDRSCLKMVLPLSILLEPEGAQRYERWLKYLCDQVHAEHGYGGLACVLPYEGHHYFPLEYQLAQEYTGLMVGPLPHIESLRLLDHIKGVSWYTIMGGRFVTQLGGSDVLRRQLSRCRDVVFHTYDDGLIIRAGALPELGSEGEMPPAAYVAVNRALKPVRVQDTGCLHPYPIRGCFSEASTALWYARFDEKPKPALSAGDACTHAGYWFSNAAAGSRRLFTKDEMMPTFPNREAGRVQWFWAEGAE
jgi:hypothetical protein